MRMNRRRRTQVGCPPSVARRRILHAYRSFEAGSALEALRSRLTLRMEIDSAGGFQLRNPGVSAGEEPRLAMHAVESSTGTRTP